MPLILFLFLALALMLYTPLLVLAGVIVIGAILYYLITLDWERERIAGIITIVVFSILLVILIAAYIQAGIPGLIMALVGIAIFGGVMASL
jgi:hypothetical protein